MSGGNHCLRHPSKPDYVAGGKEHWAFIVIEAQRWAVASAHSAHNANLTGTLVMVFVVRGWRVFFFFSVRFLRYARKSL